jgi:transcriptional regulator with XRE-family HTH domain
MDDQDRIGARVAELRKVRGLTGRQLASRANVSYSLLTKVESGHSPATPAFIGAVARALRVDVTRITGQPYEDTPTMRLQDTIEPLRRALLTFDLPDESVPVRPYAALFADARRLEAVVAEAHYLNAGQMLPALLADLSVAVHTATDADRPRLYGLLAEAYGGISSLGQVTGFLDLRATALSRIEWAATMSGDPVRIVRTQWSRAASLLTHGAYGQGLELMERARRQLGDDPSRMDPPMVSMFGSLHLRSGILAARAGDLATADAHIGEARRAAASLPADASHYGLMFNLPNVEIHSVAVAVEAQDSAQAVARADTVRLPGSVPPVRIGHHHIDVARGFLYHGSWHRALNELETARRVAPQMTRYHPMVRETIQAVARAQARPNNDVRAFASWLGIT